MSAVLKQEHARQSGQRAYDNAQPIEDEAPSVWNEIEAAIKTHDLLSASVPTTTNDRLGGLHETMTTPWCAILESLDNNGVKRALFELLAGVNHPLVDAFKARVAHHHAYFNAGDIESLRKGEF